MSVYAYLVLVTPPLEDNSLVYRLIDRLILSILLFLLLILLLFLLLLLEVIIFFNTIYVHSESVPTDRGN